MISNIEPVFFTQADNVAWQKTFAQYPTSLWNLTYYIRGAANLDVLATKNATMFLVNISSAQSSNLIAGSYWWQAVLTKGVDRITIGSGRLEVKPNIQSVPINYDGRSHVKKTLDALDAMIEKRATSDQQSYSIQGRSLSRMNIDEILVWREKYRRFYSSELREQKAQAGLGRRNKVQVRFNS